MAALDLTAAVEAVPGERHYRTDSHRNESRRMSRPGEWGTTDGQRFTAAGYRARGAVASPAMLEGVRR